MSYGVKYRIEYKDRANVNKKIDIEILDYAGAVTNCEAADIPFEIEQPKGNSILEPIVACGAKITAISTTNMMFQGLYSINPKRGRVRCYAGASVVPYFLGYINTEVFSESYARLSDYDVTIYCNDGFSVLSRFKYIDANGVKYNDATIYADTLETKWNVLANILNKMELPFQYLYFACRHTCDGVTPATSETLFHKLKIDLANYYDEQDEPFTYMAVLEALLAPYPLQIKWVDGSIYIYEPGMLAGTNFSAQRYNENLTYVDTVNISRNFDISKGDVIWDNDDQTHDIRSGFSRQKIRYSPYIPDGAVGSVDITNRYLWSGTETWTADVYTIMKLSGITGVSGYNFYDSNVRLSGRKKSDDDTEEIYLEFIGTTALSTTKNFNVGALAGQFLIVSGEVFIRSKLNEYSESEPSVTAEAIRVQMRLTIDGKRHAYNMAGYWEWITDTQFNRIQIIKDAADATICDKWMKFSMVVPWNMPGGRALVQVNQPMAFTSHLDSDSERLTNLDGVICGRIRDFKVTAYEGGERGDDNMIYSWPGAKEILTDDVEYKGDLNEGFLNEASEITLLHADARNMTDRAAIRKLDKSFTTGWRKTGDTQSHKLAHLLIRAIISQFSDSLDQLAGTLEADNLLGANGGPFTLFTIQDTDYMGNKKFMFEGGIYNDFERTLNGTYLEIKEDNLTINVA